MASKSSTRAASENSHTQTMTHTRNHTTSPDRESKPARSTSFIFCHWCTRSWHHRGREHCMISWTQILMSCVGDIWTRNSKRNIDHDWIFNMIRFRGGGLSRSVHVGSTTGHKKLFLHTRALCQREIRKHTQTCVWKKRWCARKYPVVPHQGIGSQKPFGKKRPIDYKGSVEREPKKQDQHCACSSRCMRDCNTCWTTLTEYELTRNLWESITIHANRTMLTETVLMIHRTSELIAKRIQWDPVFVYASSPIPWCNPVKLCEDHIHRNRDCSLQ